MLFELNILKGKMKNAGLHFWSHIMFLWAVDGGLASMMANGSELQSSTIFSATG